MKQNRRLKNQIISVLFAATALAAAFLGLRFGLRSYYRASYQKGYGELIERYSAQYALPPHLVYSVVRTESGFRPDAQSPVGARGLMQITYDTFEWIQHRTGQTDLTYDDLFDPEINLRCGTYLLAILLEEFGSVDTALAAYHAGRGQVNHWLANSSYSQDGEALQHIPFSDTDSYVKKVLATMNMYQTLYA